MEAAVIQTKTMANIVAQETQAECMAIQSMPVSNTQALVQSRIMLGLSQNSATVTANAGTMANSIGAPASSPSTGTPPVGPQQVAGQDPSQAMQMMGQLAGLVGQIPQMLGQAMGQVTQAPQQLAQTLGQPLQQITSMFGQGGGGAGLGGVSPFSAFSNHPLAGGGGAAAGAGMVRAAGLPGGGGGSAQSPLMASLVGNTLPVSVAPAPGAGAGSGAMGGMAPVAAGGGMGGGMGGPMMGQRGTSGGTTTGLALPEALEYDLAEDDVDEDW
jgi:hypothetical protein